mmetsp:Transcript_45828/g.111604  ORF Transcript_45828/g.111604 Transcript_45828/m.111604 type:complete len:210 (+) Transcript_45828:316-945(+)
MVRTVEPQHHKLLLLQLSVRLVEQAVVFHVLMEGHLKSNLHSSRAVVGEEHTRRPPPPRSVGDEILRDLQRRLVHLLGEEHVAVTAAAICNGPRDDGVHDPVHAARPPRARPVKHLGQRSLAPRGVDVGSISVHCPALAVARVDYSDVGGPEGAVLCEGPPKDLLGSLLSTHETLKPLVVLCAQELHDLCELAVALKEPATEGLLGDVC